MAELLHQYNVKPEMPLHNVLLPLVAHLHGPLDDQVIRHPAHIVLVDKGVTLQIATVVVRVHKCIGRLNDVFQ